ncbi:MAG: NTP transferase domain-containing protein, partial [Actinomycetota bacterium]|nr:NTP transferase domain-containing protein [Actinomycetota bacterium]
MSEVLGVVQARMSSSRLPGKVLEPILGQPMILRQLERLTRCTSLSGIVIATSTDRQDDQLASVVQDAGWTVIRGPQDDVLGRFVTVVEEQSAVAVARFTADCPLISPTVVDQVARTYVSANVDYVSNTLEPTYPDGLDVEVVRTEAL